MIPALSPRPIDLIRVRRRLDRWRRTRTHPRSRMPAALWATAVTAAHQHGVYRTAQALHLDYGGLKAHLERADGRRDAGRPTFVEVAGSTLTDLGSCVIELTGPGGTMRLRVPGLALADLATLTRTLAGA